MGLSTVREVPRYFGREAYDTLLSHAETGNFTRKVMLASHSEWSEFGTVNGARQVDPAGRFLGGNFRVADDYRPTL